MFIQIKEKLNSHLIFTILLASLIFPSTGYTQIKNEYVIKIMKMAGGKMGSMAISMLMKEVFGNDPDIFSDDQMKQFENALKTETARALLNDIEDKLMAVNLEISRLEVPTEYSNPLHQYDNLIKSPDFQINNFINPALVKIYSEKNTGTSKHILFNLTAKLYAAKIAFLKFKLDLTKKCKEECNFKLSDINTIKTKIAQTTQELRSAALNTLAHISQEIVTNKFSTPPILYGARNNFAIRYYKDPSWVSKNPGCVFYLPGAQMNKVLFPINGIGVLAQTEPLDCARSSQTYDFTEAFKKDVFQETTEVEYQLIGNKDQLQEFFRESDELIEINLDQECNPSQKSCGNYGSCNGQTQRCEFDQPDNYACRDTDDCSKGSICSLNYNRCIKKYVGPREFYLNEGQRCEQFQELASDNYLCKEGLECVSKTCVNINPLNQRCYLGMSNHCALCANESDYTSGAPHYCIETKNFNLYNHD
jgi:hypothetical protein